MKLKLTMTNAETGEVLQEETNLDFAMMAYGRKIEGGAWTWRVGQKHAT